MVIKTFQQEPPKFFRMKHEKKVTSCKKIWIDLDNSPHVLFFDPIIKELKSRGIDVLVTARNYAQVYGLAELFNIDCIKIGRHYGKNLFIKVAGTAIRSFTLLPILLKEKPCLAFSHGSRSQLVAAKMAGVQTLVAFDYEGAKGFPLLDPTMCLVPEVLFKKLEKNNLKGLLYYPGIKEDVYVPDFKPDLAILKEFEIKAENIIVTIRPPATLAHYHNVKSDELFIEIIEKLCSNDNTRVFILPRTADQAEDIKTRWAAYFITKQLTIPDKVVNGLNLMWHSDLVISGGGTMIREAAALNVPAYSFFQGGIGAVDEFLETSGRLILINNSEDIKEKIKLQKRVNKIVNGKVTSPSLKHIVDLVEEIVQ